MPLAGMLENRHSMSQSVRDEVSPKAHEWGYRLGSVYIRKVHFRDNAMIAQIEAKVKADPVEWNARIEALRNVGLQVLDIVRRKDVKELWDANQNLDEACEACHRSYWYPGENDAFYKKLNQRLDEYGQRMRGSSRAANTPK